MSDRGIDLAFRQKPDTATIFMLATNRKNMAGTYDYPSGIGVMLNNLPVKWAEWVRDQSEVWTDEREKLIYKEISGVKIGYKDDPLVWNDEHTDTGLSSEPGFTVDRLMDGSVDWSDPRIYSPYKKIEQVQNFEMKDALVHAAAEFAGLTWTVDPIEQDAGDTDEYTQIQRKQTPMRLPVHLRKLLKKAMELEEKGLLKVDEGLQDTEG